MRDRHVGALVVTHDEGGSKTLSGVVTDRDLAIVALASGMDSALPGGAHRDRHLGGPHARDRMPYPCRKRYKVSSVMCRTSSLLCSMCARNSRCASSPRRRVIARRMRACSS